jgi:CheY-like chemotaxis protein
MNRIVNILVVDDEPLVRQAITRLLRHCGHQVESVENGETALACLAQQTFDIVITDFSMPDMQGDELVQRIRQVLPAQLIIMSTAFIEEYKVFTQPAQRVDALLLKPFSIDELNGTIQRLLARDSACPPSLMPPSVASRWHTDGAR